MTVLLFSACALASLPRELSNADIRIQRADELGRLALQQKQQAEQIARQQGFAVRRQVGHTLFELMRIEDGRVFVYQTLNANAAISTAVQPLYTTPYNLNGDGQLIGIWDGGSVLISHQELVGRVTLQNSASLSNHSTHVAGTLIASGVTASARGMSPAGLLDSYDYNSDLAEMTGRAMSTPGEAGKLQISNHSYGYVTGWDRLSSPPKWYGTWSGEPTFESDMFGQYNSDARGWDDLCYDAPYYLPFKGAGNDRSDTAPAAGTTFKYTYRLIEETAVYDPLVHPRSDGWDQGGYDTISTVDTAKNIMVVGAVNDAVSSGQRYLAGASMSGFSCWGPTDDGRVKPDIVANGVGVYSSIMTSDTSYISYSGTSMATPNACGGAALLLQHYGGLFAGQYMRSSTLKGLILHTADDLGNPGPDYRFGFGLMNTKAAADLLTAARNWPTRTILKEDTVTTSTMVRSYSLDYDGSGPIKITLCWTDPPGSTKTGLDNPAKVLVNDLDVRLVSPDGQQTWYPYVLDGANPTAAATTGDNVLDNVEQIVIPSPAQSGFYTIRVSFKGTLTNDTQHYSLAVTGQTMIEQPPTASGLLTAVPIDTPIAIQLAATDDAHPNPPGKLVYTILSLPNHGTLTDPAGDIPILTVPYYLGNYGSQVIYTSRPGCAAEASFVYAADDGGTPPQGGQSNHAAVSITITIPQTVYTADMNSHPGWTLQGQWAWGTPSGSGGSYGYHDPTAGFSGSSVVGYNLSGDYANSISTTYWATTPAIDCSAIRNARLSFYRWLNVDAFSSDKAYLQISTDQTNWTTLWQHTGAVTDSSWTLQSYDLSTWADQQSTVYLRWGMGTTSSSRRYSGWNIDDVTVTGIQADSVPVTPGDFEPDCDVDFNDLTFFMDDWLLECAGCTPADLTADGRVNLEDLSRLSQYWLTMP